jgi:hypothetical protein
VAGGKISKMRAYNAACSLGGCHRVTAIFSVSFASASEAKTKRYPEAIEKCGFKYVVEFDDRMS